MSSSISPRQILDALNWRYATKKFDPAKAIAPETWSVLEASLVLAPSSIGLQPWKFFVVTDPAVKGKLVGASYGQTQPRDCSHFVVFAARRNLDAEYVDRHLARTAEVRRVTVESLASFRAMTMGYVDKARAAGSIPGWNERQAYIALGQFMMSAALIGIDTCPMEGMEPVKYDEILGLAGTGYHTVVACAAGYRAADDKYAAIPKVRFRAEEVVVRV
jgi:nitroreductase